MTERSFQAEYFGKIITEKINTAHCRFIGQLIPSHLRQFYPVMLIMKSPSSDHIKHSSHAKL